MGKNNDNPSKVIDTFIFLRYNEIMATKKGKIGKKSGYTPELQKKAEEYLRKHRGPVPTLEGLANSLDIHVDTSSDYAKRHNAYSHIHRRIAQIQKEKLITGGLEGKLNSSIVRLLLSATHGMNENSKLEINLKAIEFSYRLDSQQGSVVNSKTLLQNDAIMAAVEGAARQAATIDRDGDEVRALS